MQAVSRVVNGWLKGVSGIIFVAARKWSKTFVFVVFLVVLGTKKRLFAAPGCNWLHLVII